MKNSHARIYDILFVLVLLAAAWFRLVGLNWDQNQHLHPDERFMTMVESAMSPVKSLSDYFDTDTSTLNPNNVGYGFYVYGDLPIIIVRYVAEGMNAISRAASQYVADHGTDGIGQILAPISKISNWAGYDEVALLGRALSALADMGAIFLLYLIAARIYGRKVALLAAAFSSVAVMQIQQSHFFTVDNFATFFMFLATYFAVEIAYAKARTGNLAKAQVPEKLEAEALPAEGDNLSDSELAVGFDADSDPENAAPEEPGQVASNADTSNAEADGTTTGNPESGPEPAPQDDFIFSVLRSALFWNVVGFGVALGMSAASKINAAPLAILLPIALFVRYFQQRADASVPPPAEAEPTSAVQQTPTGKKPVLLSVQLALILLVMGALLSLVSFRVFQPYAFKGPGFLNISFNYNPGNPNWMDDFKEGLNPLNPKWVGAIKEQQDQANGDPDSPPALQWARRSKLFSLENTVAWGLGWPLGILAWLGFFYMGWRMLRGEWKQHILLWIWTGAYFAWQSMQGNPNMRYQLPVYPLLALMAAWLVFDIARLKVAAWKAKPAQGETSDDLPISQPRTFGLQSVALFVGAAVLIATAAWAYAFVSIYRVDHSRVQATKWIYQNVPGPLNLEIAQPDGTLYRQPMSYQSNVIAPATPYDLQFTAFASGSLQSIVLGHAVDPMGVGEQTLEITFSPAGGNILATTALTANFAPKADPRGESYTLKFDPPVAVEKDKNYSLHFTTSGSLLLAGAAPINESDWDDGLPLRMGGYDGYAGIYQGGLNFQMYWDDNAEKLARFTSNLDSGDYVFISSNRQWATTTRIPERYPLTISLYRNLIGCPADKDVIWCYNEAKPGMFKGGALGYDLVKVFESFPTLGPWQRNDQYAEESFTVYDHPKVLIFQKRADYDAAKVHALLGAVDLSNVVHLTPYKAASYRPMTLMLPPAQLKANRAGGTWSELFSYESFQNKYPVLGLLIWYLAIALIGWFTYLFLRLLLPGLADRGFPLARIAGLLLLAYFSWMVGSLGGTYSRLTIAIGCGLIVVVGLAAAWLKREEVLEEIRSKGKYFLSVEGIFLLFFVIDLLIRIGNPDLWHEWKGGERPMDFTFLNGVLKSTTFPPYDPWFAGGYINYYYWGYVLVGTPIKLLGIVPSLAFNFVLPTLFAMLAMGGFSVAWNLIAGIKKDELELAEYENLDDPVETPEPANLAVENPDSEAAGSDDMAPVPVPVSRPWFSAGGLRWLSGISAGLGLVLIGNLGTIQMIWDGLQRMVVPNDVINGANVSIFDHLSWAVQGVPKLFSGQTFAFYPGDWYWIPSRVIPGGPGNEITEFPLFTFLYSDLHAHMMALPLTVLAIAWALSMLAARNISRWTWLATLAFGGVIIGALRPTNTWDFPTYLALGALVTGYAIFRYANVGDTQRFGIHPVIARILLALLGMGLLAGFSVLSFQPFMNWYGQGYNSLKPWTDSRTPISSYLVHWGFFLFIITSWMMWETREWLANTPLSSLAKLKPYQSWIGLVIVAMLGLFAALIFIFNVEIAWFAVPLAFLALTLILRPGLPDMKRLALFMIATGLVITVFVDVVVLDGDIGRQNTIFKFYMQTWVMFAVASAAAIGWMVSDLRRWSNGWRNFWFVAGGLLLTGVLMFTVSATFDKIKDRMTPNIPLTLDSITYMSYASYNDNGQKLDLNQDYLAIRWLQDNIKGSPVVLEGAPAGVQYTWFSRIAIYTGLPTVVGWQWHEEQQRTIIPGGTVAARGQEVQQFYRTANLNEVKTFLQKYDVQYIVVGELERLHFPEGLAKFDEQDGKLWQTVYRNGNTAIYQVLP